MAPHPQNRKNALAMAYAKLLRAAPKRLLQPGTGCCCGRQAACLRVGSGRAGRRQESPNPLSPLGEINKRGRIVHCPFGIVTNIAPCPNHNAFGHMNGCTPGAMCDPRCHMACASPLLQIAFQAFTCNLGKESRGQAPSNVPRIVLTTRAVGLVIPPLCTSAGGKKCKCRNANAVGQWPQALSSAQYVEADAVPKMPRPCALRVRVHWAVGGNRAQHKATLRRSQT